MGQGPQARQGVGTSAGAEHGHGPALGRPPSSSSGSTARCPSGAAARCPRHPSAGPECRSSREHPGLQISNFDDGSDAADCDIEILQWLWGPRPGGPGAAPKATGDFRYRNQPSRLLSFLRTLTLEDRMATERVRGSGLNTADLWRPEWIRYLGLLSNCRGLPSHPSPNPGKP